MTDPSAPRRATVGRPTTGLLRFARPAGGAAAPEPTANPSGGTGPPGVNLPHAGGGTPLDQAERCEMCGVPAGERHGHVVDIERRTIMCTCRPCALLFAHSGAGAGHFRAVPERYRYTPTFRLTPALWDALQIPVAMAFFFHNSTQQRWVAHYPSPGGATESLLPLSTWDSVLADNPAFAEAEPDVEAVLVRREDSLEGYGRFEGYLVPIDVCYQLVGLVRLHWRGFDGGEKVWQEIGGYFAGLRERAQWVDGAEPRGWAQRVGGADV